jgi:hypothetical protein
VTLFHFLFLERGNYEKYRFLEKNGISFLWEFWETKISSKIVATNVCENIEPRFEKHYVELFLRIDIMMIYFKASCLGYGP